MENNKKIVLHTCCAVCGAYLTELLKNKFSQILIYFYNPNIQPKEEYEKRKESAEKLAEIYNLEFEEGEYEPNKWFDKIKGFEDEPEGGRRCPICFEMRLRQTAELARERGLEYFSTTLAVSPYKNEKIIDELGQKIGNEFGVKYLSIHVRNQIEQKEILPRTELVLVRGWQKTRELAKKHGFYHQKYCGCVFSQK